jgi:hypothetical protein
VVAWPRGVRDFLAGQTRDPAVIDVLARWSGYDADLIPQCVPPYMDPNGAIDVDNVKDQQTYWLRAGLVTAPAPIDQRIDLSFLSRALQQLCAASI